ncbi:MAG: ketoacyl-ACP synthase III [Bacteroidetes bacterium]|nr:ketoacyl-ACP synthase III [Bacteroidota bacterium]
MNNKPAILGIGAWVPDFRLTNFDLEKLMDTNNNWILERTGIKERRILKEGTGSSFLGIKAVENLISKTFLNPNIIDLLICCTSNPDYKVPSTASIIAKETGIVNAACFDISAACAGFIYALDIAFSHIKLRRYKNILIVAAENLSSMTQYNDRGTGILFGDAGAAVLIGPSENEFGIEDVLIKSEVSGAEQIIVRGGGSKMPFNEENFNSDLRYIRQDGKAVFKSAVLAMANVTKEILEKNKCEKNTINYLIPHQANLRIIEAVAKQMDFPMSKIPVNIEKYGNTSSVTIPLVLFEWENIMKKGDKIVLTAFGSGFSFGACYLQKAY